MPSGAKKRKAARKKKEQEANNNSLAINGNNPQGHDDPKGQDERGSDGGEIGSPASEDSQNHQHPFSVEAEENGKRDISSVHLMDAESKTVEEANKDAVTTEILGNVDGVDIRIEKAMEPEDKKEGRSDKIVCIDNSRRSSSSSSSDDKYQLLAKNVEEEVDIPVSQATLYNTENKMDYSLSGKVLPVTENASRVESDYFSAVETASNGDLVKPVLSTSEEVICATENTSLNNSVVSDMVESGRKENEEKLVPKSSGCAATQLEGNKSKMSTSDAPAPETNEIAKETQETEIPDTVEKQPVMGSAPPVGQKTSFLSCCGLFDVFTGSSR